MRDLERWVLLQLIDQHWREHLYNMDYLREGIHLRALARRTRSRVPPRGPRDVRRDDARIREEFVRYMFHIQVDRAPPRAEEQRVEHGDNGDAPSYEHAGLAGAGRDRDRRAGGAPRTLPTTARRERRGPPVAVVEQRVLTEDEKVGRNDPCPCGSRQEVQACHGA